jgi:uncharacterized protein (DUF983 family)
MTIIPIFFQHESNKCPKCKHEENVKSVCRSCGYEYTEYTESDSVSKSEWVIFIITVIGGIWIALILMEWLFGFHNDSLVEILISQWRWLQNLRIW